MSKANDGALLDARAVARFADDYKAGHTLAELAHRYGLHLSQVSKLRVQLGLPGRKVRRAKRIASPEAVAKVRARQRE